MPDALPHALDAVARWLERGCTSATHPLLRHALDAYLVPLGIEAAWLEADVWGALATGGIGWWLREARWHPAKFDRTHRAASDFAYLLDHPGAFETSVGAQGELAVILRQPAAEDTGAAAYLARSENGWLAIRHSVRAAQAAESFLFAAAGLILAGDPITALFVDGRDEEYCAAVEKKLSGDSAAAARSGSAGSSTTGPAAAARGKLGADRRDRPLAASAPNQPRRE